MSQPAAKKGDKVVGVDTHIVMVPSPAGPIPTPMPMPFSGTLDDSLSPDVLIQDKAAAVKGSVAHNQPAHVPSGGPFQKQPADKGTVSVGTKKVLINNKEAAYLGASVKTCNDPVDADVAVIVASSTVLVGE